MHIGVFGHDEFENNDDINNARFLPLTYEYYYSDPANYGVFENLTLTDDDYYYFDTYSYDSDFTIFIYVEFLSYIYGYIPSVSLTLFTGTTPKERSIGELDEFGNPYCKIYHPLESSHHIIKISPLKSDYYVSYTLYVVIYEGPPVEDPWDAIDLARPGDFPPAMIPGFSILIILLVSIISSVFFVKKISKRIKNKISF
jgi:hypothetical protein